MNQITPVEIEVLGANWPEQIIPSYDRFYKIWRSQYASELSKSSVDDYWAMGMHWCAFANGKSLTPRLMLEWHLWLMDLKRPNSPTKKIAPARVNRHHSVIKKFLRWLKVMGVITLDPSLALPTLRTPAPAPRKKFEHEEYLRIISYGSRLPNRHCQTWLTMLGYHTGMSLVDCAHLKWDEVVLRDDAPSYIQKIRAKLRARLGRKATCMIPIVAGGELWRWIKRLESRRHKNYKRLDGIDYVHQDAPLFYACDNPTISERMRSFFAEELSWRGIEGRSFKHLRNSFCSRMINSGNDAVLVSQMTGHQRLEQLAEYVVPDIRALQDAMIRALRWVEKDSGPDIKPRFLTLPSPEEADMGFLTPSPSLACAESGAAINERPS
jgi:integrase